MIFFYTVTHKILQKIITGYNLKNIKIKKAMKFYQKIVTMLKILPFKQTKP